MKINFLRCAAVALGLSVLYCGSKHRTAFATENQSAYQAPAKWSHFNVNSTAEDGLQMPDAEATQSVPQDSSNATSALMFNGPASNLLPDEDDSEIGFDAEPLPPPDDELPPPTEQAEQESPEPEVNTEVIPPSNVSESETIGESTPPPPAPTQPELQTEQDSGMIWWPQAESDSQAGAIPGTDPLLQYPIQPHPSQWGTQQQSELLGDPLPQDLVMPPFYSAPPSQTDPSAQLMAPHPMANTPSDPSPAGPVVETFAHSGPNGFASLSACEFEDQRPELNPWFSGVNWLYWQLEENSTRGLLASTATGAKQASIDRLNPGSSSGYELFGGRYLDCGRYALSVSYFQWSPSSEQLHLVPAAPGDYHAPMGSWHEISIDPDGAGPATEETVYDYYAAAASYRFRRDVSFQGVEINLTGFGLMGAKRAAAMNSQGTTLAFLGDPLNARSGYGFGGASGPLVRSDSGAVRVATSHGFRWFQFEDRFEYAADIDGISGFHRRDLYHNIDIKNNLFGYQFGSQLTYCISNRINLVAGGKFGVYGNDVEMRQRIGNSHTTAYRNGVPTDQIETRASDTAFAALGELDLGIGCRLNNAWTLRGGYRLLAASGVATTAGALDRDYSHMTSAAAVHADDSVLLHGGYLGIDFNW